MKIKIEKGIPIPSLNGRANERYPLSKMKRGDSFSAPATDGNAIRTTVSSAGKRLKMTFTVQVQADRSYRVWRIK